MLRSGLIAPDSHFSLQVPENTTSTRIDKYLSEQFPFYSRNFFQHLITLNRVLINNKIIEKSSAPVQSNDIIDVTFPPKRAVETDKIIAQDTNVSIVHEHEHFLILHKPAGLLVHPPTNLSDAVTLVDWVVHHYQTISDVGYVDRPGIVHRLDRDTSGLIVIPKTNYAHSVFGDMFRNRTIKKTYLAVVHGHPPKEGTVELLIGRDPITKTKMTTFQTPAQCATGKARTATSHYTVLEYFKDAALVEVRPVTGRTHQIRVHLTAIGHPLFGDHVYGKESSLIGRHALHAARLSFNFDGTDFSFSNDVPADFSQLLDKLRAR